MTASSNCWFSCVSWRLCIRDDSSQMPSNRLETDVRSSQFDSQILAQSEFENESTVFSRKEPPHAH